MPTIPQFANAASDVIGGVGSFIQSQGTAAADQSQAQGFSQEAALYNQAAGVAGENMTISQNSTQLQMYMANRQLQQTQADVVSAQGANGFQLGGSAEYILQNNATMGGVAQAVLGQQGALNANAYQLQQYSLQAESQKALADEAAAKAAASAANSGGILGIFGGIAKGLASFIPGVGPAISAISSAIPTG